MQKSEKCKRSEKRNNEGLLICEVCGKPKELRLSIMGMDHIVATMCDCEIAEKEKKEQEFREQQRMIEVGNMRIESIRDKERRGCRFETAEPNDMLTWCKKYVDHWSEMREKNIGLLMYGPCGNGKSFAAACIANALIDKSIPAMMTSFPIILSDQNDVMDVATQMKRYELVVLDDLGAERQSQYALEKVFYVIDERYKSNKPLIVTTNQQLEDIEYYAKSGTADYKRIYDRILEMCTPMAFTGETRRAAARQDKKQTLISVLTGED